MAFTPVLRQSLTSSSLQSFCSLHQFLAINVTKSRVYISRSVDGVGFGVCGKMTNQSHDPRQLKRPGGQLNRCPIHINVGEVVTSMLQYCNMGHVIFNQGRVMWAGCEAGCPLWLWDHASLYQHQRKVLPPLLVLGVRLSSFVASLSRRCRGSSTCIPQMLGIPCNFMPSLVSFRRKVVTDFH